MWRRPNPMAISWHSSPHRRCWSTTGRWRRRRGRETLVAGAGAVFTLEISESGVYQVDLYGLDRHLQGPFEDSGPAGR